MDEREQIETQLRQFRHIGKAQIKSTVVDAFERQQRGGGRPLGRRRLWNRAVPGYLVVGMIAVAAGLAFVAGRQTADRPESVADRGGSPKRGGPADSEVTWSIAVQDQF